MKDILITWAMVYGVCALFVIGCWAVIRIVQRRQAKDEGE